MKDILYVLRFIKPYRGYLILLILILALSSLLNVIHPYLTFSVIIDSLLPFNDFPMIAIVAVVIIVIVVILALIQLIQGYIMSYIGARVAFDIRHSLMQHVINLSLKFFQYTEIVYVFF